VTRTTTIRIAAAASVLTVAAAACGIASAGLAEPAETPVFSPTPSATPSATPRPVRTTQATPSATPAPSPEPAADGPAPTAVPSQTPVPPPPASTPSAAPQTPVVHLDAPTLAQTTADGVRVRSHPGLASQLIGAHRGPNAEFEPDLMLPRGHAVAVIRGPVVVDGHAWYLVMDERDDDQVWYQGWVAGEYLVATGPLPEDYDVLISIGGFGEGAAASAEVRADARLGLGGAAAPLPGASSCAMRIEFTRTDGSVVTLFDQVIAEVTSFGWTHMFSAALHQESAGSVAVQVVTDCSWAASVEPTTI
jgi:hypothetical protein